MSVERYMAAAGLGLFAMFVGEILIFYNYIIISPSLDMSFPLEPAPKILQFISIGIAPAAIMCGVAYIISKRYGSKSIGSMITAGGIILFLGMLYAIVQLDDIPLQYLNDTVILTPYFCLISAIPIMITGLLLFRIRERYPKKNYV